MKKIIFFLITILLLMMILSGCNNSLTYEDSVEGFVKRLLNHEVYDYDYDLYDAQGGSNTQIESNTIEEVIKKEAENLYLREYMEPEYYLTFMQGHFAHLIRDIAYRLTDGISGIVDVEVNIVEAEESRDDSNHINITAEIPCTIIKEGVLYDSMFTLFADCDATTGKITQVHEFTQSYENPTDEKVTQDPMVDSDDDKANDDNIKDYTEYIEGFIHYITDMNNYPGDLESFLSQEAEDLTLRNYMDPYQYIAFYNLHLQAVADYFDALLEEGVTTIKDVTFTTEKEEATSDQNAMNTDDQFFAVATEVSYTIVKDGKEEERTDTYRIICSEENNKITSISEFFVPYGT